MTSLSFPAWAGTLTSATATALSPSNVVSNTNSRYDYSFNTATSSSLSKVTVGVPRGTDAPNRYFDSAGTSGNYASTPDSTTNSITGDFEIRAKANLNWATGSGFIVSKVGSSASSQKDYALVLGTGTLTLQRYLDCNGATGYTSDVDGFADGTTQWVRATMQINNGSGLSVATFYSSPDGVTWNQIGATKTSTNTAGQCDSVTQVEIGSRASGTNSNVPGKYYYADIRNGIGGAIANKFDPNNALPTSSSWNATDTAAETWTVTRSGSTAPADIASDIAVSNVSGLPATGAAKYRFIDGLASYAFTSTSVPAATPCTVSFGGLTSTSVAGNYASPITTLNGTAVVDSVASPVLYIVALANAVVAVAVDPTFSFTVASHSGACNSVVQTAGVITGSTGVSLGRVTSASGSVAAQDLSVGTNANTGFSLQLRTSSPLTAGSNTIANAPGTNVSPAVFPVTTTAAFGYTVSGLSRFTNAWAGLETTNREVMNGSTVGTVTNCIAYRVQVTASTPAGSYSSTAYYTAIPSF